MVKMKKLRLTLASIFFMAASVFTTLTVATPAYAACNKETEVEITISIQGQNKCIPKTNAIFTWLTGIIRFLSAGVGIAVVGGIVYGGILYLTARDNASQIQQAITVIINAVIGLLLYILMFAILNFLIPGGILT
jgi:hypothetical protein